MSSQRLNWRLAASIVALLGLVSLGITRDRWLPGIAQFLVKIDAPAPADVAVVLGGDHTGFRILKSAELVRQRYVPLVLVSGPTEMYGFNEAELAIAFAARAGYPESWFLAVPTQANSTREEALALASELRKRSVRRCLLVTSFYHTRRAGRIFRQVIPEIEFRVVGAPYPHFEPRQWWKTREGLKTVVLEWEKTLAAWLGI